MAALRSLKSCHQWHFAKNCALTHGIASCEQTLDWIKQISLIDYIRFSYQEGFFWQIHSVCLQWSCPTWLMGYEIFLFGSQSKYISSLRVRNETTHLKTRPGGGGGVAAVQSGLAVSPTLCWSRAKDAGSSSLQLHASFLPGCRSVQLGKDSHQVKACVNVSQGTGFSCWAVLLEGLAKPGPGEGRRQPRTLFPPLLLAKQQAVCYSPGTTVQLRGDLPFFGCHPNPH